MIVGKRDFFVRLWRFYSENVLYVLVNKLLYTEIGILLLASTY